MEQVDVLIVGGGPAGLATAEKAAAGGNVLLVHKDAEIGRPVRTSGGSWMTDVKRLGLAPRLYHEINSLVFAGPTRSAQFAFGHDKPVVLDVTATYKHLAALAEDAGAVIAPATTLIGVEVEKDDRYICELRHKDTTRHVAARYVVDASGFQRAALKRVGIEDKATRYGIGAEAEFEDLSAQPARAILFVGTRYAPAGYGWVFPTTHGTVRVGIGLTRPDVQAAPARLLKEFLCSDAARDLGLCVGRLVEEHGGVVPAVGPSRRVAHGNLLAVGDSAGQVLPIVGEGIRFCIEAGRQAGSALNAALRQPSASSARLAGYENWWLRTYYRRFVFAQKINERISRFEDAQWDGGVSRLALLDGDMMAALLRADPLPVPLLRFLCRNPLAALRYIEGRARRRLTEAARGGQ